MKRVGIIILLLLSALTLCSQEKSAPPVFLNASVVPGTGQVTLNWEITDSADVKILRDSVELVNAMVAIATIKDTSIVSYSDISANASEQARRYVIRTIDPGSGDDSENSRAIHSYHLNSVYDSCARSIALTWSEYISEKWPRDDLEIEEFIIFQSIDGSTFNEIQTLNDTTYLVQPVEENKLYEFYVRAVHADAPERFSNSSLTSEFTKTAQSPDFINTLQASVIGETIELQFEIANNSELQDYKLLRKRKENSSFDTISSLTTNSYAIAYTDEEVSPAEYPYDYKLLSINGCGRETTNSDTISSILLTLNQEALVVDLEWNKLKENKQSYYMLYRQVGEEAPQMLTEGPDILSFEDDLSALEGENSSSTICYYVEAMETSGSLVSLSSIQCAYLTPAVFLPEAFTPNGDGINDLYKPGFSFIPTDYEMVIYNRWGQEVFHSTSPDEYWDGKANGKRLPPGSYIVHLRITTPRNQIIEKSGNITIYYP